MADKVTCPVCLGILYRPIALPCAHEFCRECILNAVEHTSYQCPICRYRLSNWLRKVKDIDVAVDEDKENHLRDLFPNYYREKELGKSPMLSAAEQRCLRGLMNDNQYPKDGVPAAQGEVYSDYLKELEKEARIRAIEEKKNEEASLALALQLLAEDSIAEDETCIAACSTETTDCNETPLSTELSQIASSSESSSVPSEGKKQAKSTCRKTLLDYAVYKQPLPSDCSPDQVSLDAQFAKELQAEYRKTSPAILTRSRAKSRTLRSRNR